MKLNYILFFNTSNFFKTKSYFFLSEKHFIHSLLKLSFFKQSVGEFIFEIKKNLPRFVVVLKTRYLSHYH